MGEHHFVLQNVDWAGDVKDRCSHSGISVWVKNSAEKFGHIVYMLHPGNDLCNYSSEFRETKLEGQVRRNHERNGTPSERCNFLVWY